MRSALQLETGEEIHIEGAVLGAVHAISILVVEDLEVFRLLRPKIALQVPRHARRLDEKLGGQLHGVKSGRKVRGLRSLDPRYDRLGVGGVQFGGVIAKIVLEGLNGPIAGDVNVAEEVVEIDTLPRAANRVRLEKLVLGIICIPNCEVYTLRAIRDVNEL